MFLVSDFYSKEQSACVWYVADCMIFCYFLEDVLIDCIYIAGDPVRFLESDGPEWHDVPLWWDKQHLPCDVQRASGNLAQHQLHSLCNPKSNTMLVIFLMFLQLSIVGPILFTDKNMQEVFFFHKYVSWSFFLAFF